MDQDKTTVMGGYGSAQAGGSADATLSHCIVRANTCDANGGGAYGGALYNTLVIGNAASNSGGGVCASALHNCTVAENAGGMAYGSAVNSIVYGNSGYQWMSDDSGPYQYTCTTPQPDGIGCVTNDPALTSDYRLSAASPCVNAGSNEAWMAGATDLAGSNRIQNAAADLGAYESPWWGMHADVDADRFDDWTEVNITGTDPTNASSFLQISGFGSPDVSSSGLIVRWASVAGKLYNVDRATNLMAPHPPFTNIFSGVSGQPDFTTVTDTTATAEGPYFYRVGIGP